MLVTNITKNISEYISAIGINLSDLSRKSGVSYPALYTSLVRRTGRDLRANELVSICFVLKIDPMDFAEDPTKEGD